MVASSEAINGKRRGRRTHFGILNPGLSPAMDNGELQPRPGAEDALGLWPSCRWSCSGRSQNQAATPLENALGSSSTMRLVVPVSSPLLLLRSTKALVLVIFSCAMSVWN
jgi:hypothetical protein